MFKTEISFADLGLKTPILNALTDLGYKKPSPIQIKCIPYLLSGYDVLGIAQTGSGKTAAFSLPLLNNIDTNLSIPQVLILVPTRELVLQIKNSCTNFSKYLKKIKIATIYGGQNYDIQIKSLKDGPQIIVSTPGRLLDHLKRKNLNLLSLNVIILDEADEMLRIGFIEDIESILSQLPSKHQTALFSATMPEEIRQISYRFMNHPKEVSIISNINNNPKINQYYALIKNIKKSEALLRFLEVEEFDAVIIFVRTKITTFEISEKLNNSGYNKIAVLNGDISQVQREQTVKYLREGYINILIATDVAARGLDIDRINLVINYDIPLDCESYIHRIGRTGRAGKLGKALLLVEKREYYLLRNIKRTIKINITEIKLPTNKIIFKYRLEKFMNDIRKELKNNNLDIYHNLLKKLKQSINFNIENLTVVLLKIIQDKYQLFDNSNVKVNYSTNDKYYSFKKSCINKNKYISSYLKKFKIKKSDNYKNTYRIEIGHKDGVKIKHIVGSILNKSNISSHNIGNIKLYPYYSTIEFKQNLSEETLIKFNKIRILDKPLNMKLAN